MNDPSSNPARIMVVDDTPENLRLMQDLLQDHGYQVFALPSGEMALKAAAKHPPDLILLDIKMPGLNGYEVCERLRADLQTAEIPVIFLSALNDPEDKVKAFKVGGVDYITKPYRFEEVDARVRTHLKIQKQKSELQASYEQLKKVEELRDNLVHMIVHDMRSPLTVMMNYLDLMEEVEERNLSPEGIELLGFAITGTKSLLEMVNSMLDVSRLEAGQLPLKLVEQNLAELISNVINELCPLKGNRELIVDVPASLAVTVDPDLMARVIRNLADNALRFTRAGQWVRIGALQASTHVRVFVADNGPGIPLQYHRRIFEKFAQVELRKEEKQCSTGLGLTFCKLAVEAHGGRIGVESEEGRGSTFWFELPQRGVSGSHVELDSVEQKI